MTSIYICGHTSSYMHMLNSSLLGNEKLRDPVVRNAGGVKTNTKNVLEWNHALLFNIQSSDYGTIAVAKTTILSTFARSTVSFRYV